MKLKTGINSKNSLIYSIFWCSADSCYGSNYRASSFLRLFSWAIIFSFCNKATIQHKYFKYNSWEYHKWCVIFLFFVHWDSSGFEFSEVLFWKWPSLIIALTIGWNSFQQSAISVPFSGFISSEASISVRDLNCVDV